MAFNRKIGFLLSSSLVVLQPSVLLAQDSGGEWYCRPSQDGGRWECVNTAKSAGPLPQPKEKAPDGAMIATEAQAKESPAEEMQTVGAETTTTTDESTVDTTSTTDETNAEAPDNVSSTNSIEGNESKEGVSEDQADTSTRPSSEGLGLAPDESLDWVPLSELTEEQRVKAVRICGGAYIDPASSISVDDEDPETAPIHASADQSRYEEEKNVFVLQGNVKARQSSRQIGADEVTWQPETKQAQMSGHVYFREPGFLLKGDNAKANLGTGEVEMDNAEYLLHKGGVRGDATRLSRQEDGVIVVDKGRYTTCVPGSDEWYLVGEDVRLNTKAGYGTAKHARITIKGVPIAYFPYLIFPINNQRKSGFLIPEVGVSSDSGFELAVPYYWNIAPNYDATITPRILTKRGLMLEGEFRYLQPGFQGEIGAAFLPSDNEYDNENRWLIGWLHDSDRQKRWITHVDFTRVSDDDYFEDLDTSLNFSSQTHLLELGETIYRGDNWDFTARLQGYQTIDEFIDEVNDPYARLPQLLFTGTWPQNNFPVEYSMKAEYVYFDRDPHDLFDPYRVVGHRFHVEPGIRMPFEASWGYLTPSAKFSYTQYALEDQMPGEDDSPSRALPILSLDSGLYFDKTWELADGGSFTQTLEPRLYYLYIPFENQNDIPLFDTSDMTFSYSQLFRENRFAGGDRVGDANQLTLSLTTRVIDDASGEERLRASLGQILYFEDREISLTGDADDEKTHDDRSSSAFAGEIVYRSGRDWYMYGDFLYDPHDSELDQGSVGLRYNPDDNHIINLGYRKRLDIVENYDINQTDVSFVWPVADKWSVLGRWNYDIDRSRTIETIAGLEYEACCWRIRVIYRQWLDDNNDFFDADSNQGVFVQLQLRGLGGVGNKVSGVLDKGILGFSEREKNDSY